MKGIVIRDFLSCMYWTGKGGHDGWTPILTKAKVYSTVKSANRAMFNPTSWINLRWSDGQWVDTQPETKTVNISESQ